MKKITTIGLLMMVMAVFTNSSAVCKKDSVLQTLTTKNNTTVEVIERSGGQVNVKVYEQGKKNELKKVYEGVFTDEKEYEKWTVKNTIETAIDGFGIFGKKKKGKKHRKHHKKYAKSHWAGIGLGFCTITDGNKIDNVNGMSIKGEKSNEFFINLFEARITPKNSHFALSTGLGLDWKNFRFDNARLVEEKGVTKLVSAPAGVHYDFARLRTFYVTIPLIATYQPTRKIYMSAGIVGGINAFTSQKLKYKALNGDYIKRKNKDGLNVARFTYHFEGEIGYGSVGIFAKYSPMSVFQKDKGYDVGTASLGLKLNF